LLLLGFSLKNGTGRTYRKVINSTFTNFWIEVDFVNQKISYDESADGIKIWERTTLDFSHPENFVVLECVNRLVEKGYRPNSIELEKFWPSGHGTSGRLDILVRNNDKPYLMIECKTSGAEYNKEKKNMLTLRKSKDLEEPAGQLWSYLIQERDTNFLCLYTSGIDRKSKKVFFENSIVSVLPEWKTLNSQRDIFDRWSKNFIHSGIFETDVTAYHAECKSLRKKDLIKLSQQDSHKIFNQFLEILRHNTISDKPNAFNKILNLFICKIVDEENSKDNDFLNFQWKTNSTFESMQSTLEDLYRQGISNFINVQVVDHSEKELERLLDSLDKQAKKSIQKIFSDLRLKKNPEFAFREVYNDESFEENGKVLKEIILLLQPYQFRYGHKQQFLGDFFEQLLSTSIKQEAGQFFTPIPIARFMISCLPITELIEEISKQNFRCYLPTMIDYACGSGHFLTEYMDIVQQQINQLDLSKFSSRVQNSIRKWQQIEGQNIQGAFEWASEYVYGIERDYRLVKATKVNTFLNGDGDATIICADGLAPFDSDKYEGKLFQKVDKSNNNFDLVIANPPYSVTGFRDSMRANSSDFSLYNYLSTKSSEIECLFVERAAQLLKVGGKAAIILPVSLLSNQTEIEKATRHLLLTNFFIRGIVKLGTHTFMATGINTVILFLERRDSSVEKTITFLIDKFFTTQLDFAFDSIPNIIETGYLKDNFEISLNEYISILNGTSSPATQQNDLYVNSFNVFRESREFKEINKKNEPDEQKKKKLIDQAFTLWFKQKEKEKIKYYLLTKDQKLILVNTAPDKDSEAEKKFIGYTFSSRRGQEGLHINSTPSALYDPENLFGDPEKVNHLIRESFLKNDPAIPEELVKNVKGVGLNELLDFGENFSNTIKLVPSHKIRLLESKDRIGYYLRDLCLIEKGTSITSKEISQGDVPVIAGGKTPAYYHSTSNRSGDIITVSASGAYAGFVSYYPCEIFASDCTTIRSKNENVLLTKFLFYTLKQAQQDLYLLQKGQAQPHVYGKDLGAIKIFPPSLEEQHSLVDKVVGLENEISEMQKSLQQNQTKVTEAFGELFNKSSNP